MANDITDKLPEALKAVYCRARKVSVVVERLKVVAALKLWFDRGYREVGFEVSSDLGGRAFYVDVLAMDEGGMVGVECVGRFDLGWLRGKVGRFRRCLPVGCYLVVIFPFGVDDERVKRAVGLVDEVWVTDKTNSKIEQMLCTAVFHKG